MPYQSVGWIHRDDPDGGHTHTEVLECGTCGALVSANSFADHDHWHRWHTETVTGS
jgi:hypothetical protein